MKILLDQAVYDQRNKGNVALLQAAVGRLRGLWPDATIQVLTEAPHLLRLYCPTVDPVRLRPQANQSWQTHLRGDILRLLPRPVLRALLECRDEVRHRVSVSASGGWRKLFRLAFKSGAAPHIQDHKSVLVSGQSFTDAEGLSAVGQEYLDAIQHADLVVATGGGYLCSANKMPALQVYRTLELAVQMGKPAAMVGLGVGVFREPSSGDERTSVLPRLDLILIREPKLALPLLDSLGVPLERVLMTGDDAIEMAYEQRPSRWGNSIGVNLRTAHYTEVDQTYVEKVRLALHQAARKRQAPLLALPTSSHLTEGDLEVVRQILRDYEKGVVDWRRFDQPLEMIRRVGRCRLVVTGAFHPAVFALAQGIPVVGLFKSTYAFDKFTALQNEFGPAIQLVCLDDERFSEKLPLAIDAAWESAEQVRPQLLETATRLIELGQAGYERLYHVWLSRSNAAPSRFAPVGKSS